MSAGGFIAQALLGGTQGAAQGIGNKIREEAKLKRQQALEGTRTEHRMQEQAHGSALAIGQQNLQNEHSSAEAERNREHELAMAEKQHGRQKDLADYKLKTELTLAREKAESSGKLNDWQNANLDRINGSIDNLQKMERDLMTGKTDGMDFSMMGPEAGPEPQDASEKLAIIRQRLKAEEIKFNRVLGNQRGVDAGMAVLSQAANITGDQDKQEFLADFRESQNYSEDVERQVMQVWDSKDKPSQKVDTAQTQPEPAQSSQPGQDTVLAQDPPAPQPEGGMISQASAAQEAPEPDPEPTPQPTADERPGANPRPPQNDPGAWESGASKISRRFGDAGNAVMDLKDRMTEKQRKFSLQQLQEIAVRDGSKLSPTAKAQILQAHGRAIEDASPEVIEQLKAIFGAEAIEKYLN